MFACLFMCCNSNDVAGDTTHDVRRAALYTAPEPGTNQAVKFTLVKDYMSLPVRPCVSLYVRGLKTRRGYAVLLEQE